MERSLGAGGMGEVFLVRHTGLNERFALKVLRRDDPNDPRAVARFQREARAAAGLRGEHTVRVTDFGQLDDGSPFFVMEHIDGPSLAAMLRRGPLAPADAVRVVIHACAALAEAHALGIIHRDIKPANLLMAARSDGSPLVKLADFGVARLLQKVESLTETRASLGSPAYMSPEQIRDARSADTRSDIWSLGVTLHELLAGQTPFHAFTSHGIISRVLTEEPTPLRSLCPSLPDGLLAVVERCLAKDPARRYPSVLDLADALSPFAPEPGEGARVRRIWSFALRTTPPLDHAPPVDPSRATEGQTTDAPTSLTHAPETAPRARTAPSSAQPSASSLPLSARRLWLPAAALSLLVGLAWFGVGKRPSATPGLVASAAPEVTPPTPTSAPTPTSLPAAPIAPEPPSGAPLPATAPLATALPVARPLAPQPTAPAPSARPAPKRPAAPGAVNRPSLGEFGSRQ